MKTLRLTGLVCGCLLAAALVLVPLAAQAAPCARPSSAGMGCIPDQEMWINGGGDGFGGAGVPGQTFVPSAQGRVCKVEVIVHKNDRSAGPLTLRILRSNFTQVAARSIRDIPMGGPQVVTFEFGCATGPWLRGAPFYGLVLQSSASPHAGYTWINSDDAGADAAYPAGRGWYNAAGGAPGGWEQTGYDYAFKVYMCR